MSKYKGYPIYKDSGMEWLGQVPEHWKVMAFKRVSIICNGRDYKDIEDLAGAYPVIGSGGEFARATSFMFDGESVLLGRKGTIDKPLYINGPFWAVDTMFYTKIVDNAFPKFVYYAALNIPFGLYSTNTALPSMTGEDLSSHVIVAPKLDEQREIASFLDRETARIDALIAAQHRLIELLKEKRQAVISHAVTKGLDPTVPMKDSGVEWLGEVPEHWEVKPLKYVVLMKSGDQITTDDINESGEYPVFGGNGLRGYTPIYTHDGWFPLIGRQGALCGNVNYAMGKFWASEHAVVVTPQTDCNILWLGELLRTMNLGQYSITAAQPGLSVDVIGNLRIPFPKITEQTTIAAFLDRETARIDALIAEAEKGIVLLKERRSALISAAVTGKIDIRKTDAAA
jgi:type I restriction enzyme S subunit